MSIIDRIQNKINALELALETTADTPTRTEINYQLKHYKSTYKELISRPIDPKKQRYHMEPHEDCGFGD